MYKAAHFTEADTDAIVAFMQAHNFATLIGSGENGSEATQLPLLTKLIDGEIVIEGHLQKKTGHLKALIENPKALLLFTGPHCYISSKWYEPQNTASTWNYMTVQIKGDMEWLNHEGTIEAIKNLTTHYEGRAKASAFDNMEPEYIAAMSKAIVGFRLVAKDVAATFKLSQNKSLHEQQNIITGLEANPSNYNNLAVASEMKKRLPKN